MSDKIDPYRMELDSVRALCSDLLETVQELESDIQGLREQRERDELYSRSYAKLLAARFRESVVMDRYRYDGTGQDGEDEISAAIQDRLDAEDALIRCNEDEATRSERLFGC